MFSDRDLKLLVTGIVLVGLGWLLPINPRIGGVVMLAGAALMLVAQYRMVVGARRRKRR